MEKPQDREGSGQAESGRRKHAYHHGDLRQALIAAAYRLIRDHGVSQFSVADACKQVGVSSAALYRHFESREDLLRAVAIEGFDELARTTNAENARFRKGSASAIAAGGCGYVRFARGQPEVFRMMFGSSPNLRCDNEVHEHGMRCFGTLLDQLAARYGTDDEEEIKRHAFPLWTFVHGTAFLLIDEVYDHFVDDHDVEAMIGQATHRLLTPVPVLDEAADG
ncbi:MAG: TetR/AcrR family transcriptional regulator [Alphaproteobacteria bacterium]|nr:TetR/AcrR family transcriptional regulator [Alphaproteobacteria bacterium]